MSLEITSSSVFPFAEHGMTVDGELPDDPNVVSLELAIGRNVDAVANPFLARQLLPLVHCPEDVLDHLELRELAVKARTMLTDFCELIDTAPLTSTPQDLGNLLLQ